jgi:hypothetical protein
VSRPPASDERKVLSRELSVFLVQFSIALHKHSTYPPGHPQLATALDSVLDRLGDLFREREVLSIGVSKQQLLIEGVATDSANPVLRELAQRLHRQQLGAIRLLRGVTGEELADVLTKLSLELQPGGKALGLQPAEELARLEHIRLVPMAFDQMELAGESEPLPVVGGQGHELWLQLAAAALIGIGGESDSTEPPDAAAIASEINRRPRDATYDRVIVGYLLEMGRELRVSEGQAAALLRSRVATLLAGLRPDVLNRLLDTGADLAQRRELLLDVAPALPVSSVMEVLRAASAANGQTISHALLRILGKLAQHVESEGPVRPRAESAMRDTVRQLVEGWTLVDPNPGGYTSLLDELSRAGKSTPGRDVDDPTEGLRIVQTALELGEAGEALWQAMDEMIQRGQATALIDILDHSPASPEITEACWVHLATPHCVRRLLLHESQDPQGIDRLLNRMGMSAAEPMLEALEVADSRAVRRRLLTRLSQLGPPLGPLIVPRLNSAPWFVQRNMLALLGTMPVWPEGFSPHTYAEHEDPRVRREVIKMMLHRAALRDDAILRGLADEDDQVQRMALAAVSESCPPSAVPRLMALLNDRNREAEVRALGIRALAGLSTPSVRSWLLEHVITKGGWFRRRRLAPRSPETLAVISVLATRWREDPKAAEVLRMAEASADPEIRAAAKGSTG